MIASLGLRKLCGINPALDNQRVTITFFWRNLGFGKCLGVSFRFNHFPEFCIHLSSDVTNQERGHFCCWKKSSRFHNVDSIGIHSCGTHLSKFVDFPIWFRSSEIDPLRALKSLASPRNMAKDLTPSIFSIYHLQYKAHILDLIFKTGFATTKFLKPAL